MCCVLLFVDLVNCVACCCRIWLVCLIWWVALLDCGGIASGWLLVSLRFVVLVLVAQLGFCT